MNENIKKLEEMLADTKHIVFFGGAGVSTESGIPDFRSKDGLYNQHDVNFDAYAPEYLLSHDCLVNEPQVFYEYYRQKMDARDCKPNAAHQKLAAWEEEGKLGAVITQNIDGLHQKAGSKTVYELHGSTLRNYCMACGKRVPADFIFDSEELIPHCPTCGGVIRPEVTLYGEALPEDAWAAALKAVQEADCLIIGGTSLVVYPAASIIDYFAGKYLIVINRETTPRDAHADLVLHEKIGEVFSQL